MSIGEGAVSDPGTLTRPVDPETLRVVRIGADAYVIGDGAWVATFADATEAARYITRCLTLGYWPVGRVEMGERGAVAECDYVDCQRTRTE